MKSFATALVALSSIAAAAPTARKYKLTDGDILNYALTLEHLEDTFYRQGLAKFGPDAFAAAGYASAYERIQTIASDEATHVSFLTTALTAAGVKPVAECVYNFPYTDVQSFLATASVLEGVGVSAYLGAAADIMSKDYLTAAGTILTVEARHSAYIRQTIGQEPYPNPFDTPLSENSVFTLASQFIVSCPKTNVALPLKAFPVLTATSKMSPIKPGSVISLSAPKMKKPKGKVYAAFVTFPAPIYVEAKPAPGGGYTAQVPAVDGQVYVVLNNCNTAFSDDTILAGPAVLEVDG